ncbi:MAG: hypothetical protein KGI89_16890 [Euryarchaeota archaeon]|nr:hypothetical protein [Euryarchaeota archaeon]
MSRITVSFTPQELSTTASALLTLAETLKTGSRVDEMKAIAERITDSKSWEKVEA